MARDDAPADLRAGAAPAPSADDYAGRPASASPSRSPPTPAAGGPSSRA